MHTYFSLKILSLTSKVRLSFKKVLGYFAHTNMIPLSTLKNSLYTSFNVEEVFLPNKVQQRESLVPFL